MGKSLSEPIAIQPPQRLSPSSIETWHQCPLKFKYTRIDMLNDPAGPEAVLGSFVHEVLEHLYWLPQEDRTLVTAKTLARNLWDQNWRSEAETHVSPQALRQFRWQAWWCVENLFELENPGDINLGGIEHKFETEIGGVSVRGVIDRWYREGDELVVGDYKTGKTPAQRFRAGKFFQLFLYSIALSQTLEKPVKRVELLYLKGGDVLSATPTEENLVQTVERIVDTRAQIEEACATGVFEAVPSRLCDWCAFKTTICPYWNGDKSE